MTDAAIHNSAARENRAIIRQAVRDGFQRAPMPLLLGLIALVASLFTSGCQSAGAAGATATADYFEHRDGNRIYVLGSVGSDAKFQEDGHIPIADTRVGGGPAGETVVIEANSKDPALAARLWAEFKARHLFYEEIARDGRIYLVGSPESKADFMAQGHMTLTHTVVGYGPKGETVIAEVAKKNPRLQYRLLEEFAERHRFYAEVHHDNRIYVLGSAATKETFAEQPHLPYAETMIGVAHKTLVFELDPKNPWLQRRLKATYAERHGVTFN